MAGECVIDLLVLSNLTAELWRAKTSIIISLLLSSSHLPFGAYFAKLWHISIPFLHKSRAWFVALRPVFFSKPFFETVFLCNQILWLLSSDHTDLSKQFHHFHFSHTFGPGFSKQHLIFRMTCYMQVFHQAYLFPYLHVALKYQFWNTSCLVCK